jgi:pimeloyl-ACP methyl ester carboxylesterase
MGTVSDAACIIAGSGARRLAREVSVRTSQFLKVFSAVLVILILASSGFAQDQPSGVTTYTGTFADGAKYLIEVPSNWNGTLLLYSHGYNAGPDNPAYDASDPYSEAYLLIGGYALGGSSYATTGWAIKEALPDQIAVLDKFQQLVGTPRSTIAWGLSMGGIITGGLIQQYPDRFQGAMPVCGVMGGAVGFWNEILDSAFAFQTLLAPHAGLQLVNITDPTANLNAADAALNAAQQTSQGRARLALVAALADVPGWTTTGQPPPPPTDYVTQEYNQYGWLIGADFPFTFYFRAELESRAGGNPSFNSGVDYVTQLNQSADAQEVRALYQQAGLDLNADLQTLNAATRISAKPSSLTYLEQAIDLYKPARVPVLTVHTEADGLVAVQDESAYRAINGPAGPYLRQVYVRRAGHCAFTAPEMLAAMQALLRRVDTQVWSGLTPAELNSAANHILVYQNREFAPAFDNFTPTAFLRPFYGYPQ